VLIASAVEAVKVVVEEVALSTHAEHVVARGSLGKAV
jgi:hypothetical protein